MSKVRVEAFGVSIDGYSSAPGQSLEHPFGPGGLRVMEWVFPTRYFAQMHGEGAGGEVGVDDTKAEEGFANVGAWILGRNMFAPSRGPWTDDGWKGWWGPNPPYHVATFILTHHKREPLVMEGGTTFYFVTDGIHSALEQAKKAAGAKDVRIGGGATTVRQYLDAGLVDVVNLAISPVLLGAGDSIYAGVDLAQRGYEVTRHAWGERAMHVTLTKKKKA